REVRDPSFDGRIRSAGRGRVPSVPAGRTVLEYFALFCADNLLFSQRIAEEMRVHNLVTRLSAASGTLAALRECGSSGALPQPPRGCISQTSPSGAWCSVAT